MQYSSEIKGLVTMPQILSMYGFQGNKGKIQCPFHGEKTSSLGYNDKVWHCFGCGEGGDVIRFVEKFYGLSFIDACKKISSDFGLRVFDNDYEETPHSVKISEEARKKKLEEDGRMAVMDLLVLENHRLRKCKPNSIEEYPSHEFMKALREIEYVEYLYRQGL